MPANKYTRALYTPGTVAAERAAIANRNPARKIEAEKITKQEGTTNPGGGRPVVRMPVSPPKPPKPPKLPPVKPPQVIRTTTNMKSSPMTSKRK